MRCPVPREIMLGAMFDQEVFDNQADMNVHDSQPNNSFEVVCRWVIESTKIVGLDICPLQESHVSPMLQFWKQPKRVSEAWAHAGGGIVVRLRYQDSIGVVDQALVFGVCGDVEGIGEDDFSQVLVADGECVF